jgi:hypothetical protein
VHVAWDNRGMLSDGVRAWHAQVGEFSLPRRMFENQVRSFHNRLMRDMADRVHAVRDGALAPDIQIDVAMLADDHRSRDGACETALARSREPADWTSIRAAIVKASSWF